MGQIERGFSTAFAAALLSDAPRCGLRMGASLYAGSRLLSLGANRWCTHPASDNKYFNRSFHAENVALVRRKHYDIISRLTMYIGRMREDGTIGCSRPCNNCLELMRLAGVRRVWFYDEQEKQTEVTL
jgi:deoxycytidylate deaminase